MHWRRFRISDIPTHDEDSFEKWLLARWREKDELLQHYQVHGRFTVDTDGKEPLVEPIETEVRPAVWFEWGQIFVPCALTTLLVNAVLGITSL
jgi:lysocardiolipin and lysophospholipid acyltransferase